MKSLDQSVASSSPLLGTAGPSLQSGMKVLLLSDSFLPHTGGSREYYHSIYGRLADLGDTSVRILTKKVDGWRKFDRTANRDCFRISRFTKPLASCRYRELPKGLTSFLHAAWHLALEYPDIVHAGDWYPPGLVASFLKKTLGLPYVIYCHGEEITQTDRYRYQPHVRNRIYKNADAVIANSEFARKNLLRIGVEEQRIHKITPGVDASRFRPSAPKKELRERYCLEGKTVLLTVARLVPRKGHRLVLCALAQIAAEFPHVQYLIVGTGPEEQALRQLAQEIGLGKRVTFVGLVEQERLPDIYNLCDIMVMPNREDNGDIEGFGMVFLEANAAGKPVIGGRSGGAIEAIVEGATGFLVDPNNTDELAEILRRLLLDRELRKSLGTAGLRRVRSEFDWTIRAELLRKMNITIINDMREDNKGSLGPLNMVSQRAFCPARDHPESAHVAAGEDIFQKEKTCTSD